MLGMQEQNQATLLGRQAWLLSMINIFLSAYSFNFWLCTLHSFTIWNKFVYKFFSSLWSHTFFKFPCRGFCNFSRSIFWNNAEEITTWVLARSSPCKLLFFIQLSFETLFSYLSAFPALDLYQLSKKVFLVAIHWCSDVWNVFAHMQYCNLFPESYLEVKY